MEKYQYVGQLFSDVKLGSLCASLYTVTSLLDEMEATLTMSTQIWLKTKNNAHSA